MKRTALKRRLFLPTILFVILIPVAFASVRIMQDPIKPWMRPTEWPSNEENNLPPDLKVKGRIVEFTPNSTSTGWVSYHTFPAMIVLNETETLWTSDPSWDNKRSVRVGYDYEDVPNLAVGISVEIYGNWLTITDTPYSFIIIVGPQVNGSYVKPIP